MAVTTTTTLVSTNIMGSEVVKKFTLAFSGTYLTAGIAFTPAQFGLDSVDFIIAVIDGHAANTNGVPTQIAPDLTSNVFILFGGGTSTATVAALANATDISGLGVTLLVYGVA